MKAAYETPESIEARAIMRLVSMGTTTLEGARELIAIPEREKAALNAFCDQGGKEGGAISSAVRFRARVLEEFNKLAAMRVNGDVPETAAEKFELAV